MSDIHRPDFKRAALSWFEFGFIVIPIIPGTKQSRPKWDPWLDRLSTKTIQAHWDEHPDDEVGCIVGDGTIVFDADTTMSATALAMLEEKHGLIPQMTVTTARGTHHHFKRAPDTCAKSDSHCSDDHPERIDVKTGRSLVILPPSTGKQVEIRECSHVDGLSEVSQEFIDAVFLHNGRQVTRPPAANMSSPALLPDDMDKATREIHAMLQVIDPDCSYDDWLHVGMAIYHETGGSEEGYRLFNNWSSKGCKYRGEQEILTKWKSFHGYTGSRITVNTLRSMVKAKGHDWIEICSSTEPGFEVCEDKTIVVRQCDAVASESTSTKRNDGAIVFRQFSLTGSSAKLEAEALAQVYVLDQIALLGQWTVLYARHNTGKTLIVIYLLVEVIKKGAIKASDVFYFNLDDTQQGLTEKTKIAEEMGFHILCDGYHGFKVADFIDHIEELCEKNQARGVVFVLDTLKKFTDLMDKRKVSRWNEVMRRFVAKGGTLIALAHVNKNPGADGKSVYAGTSDSLDDADCGYVLDVVGTDDEAKTKVVEFENRKRRGNVINRVSYSFSIEDGLSYQELLASVTPVDEMELLAVKQAEEIKSDAEIIEAVVACIRDGINTKMRLRDAVRDRIGCSRRSAIRVIEKYAGSDPTVHRWTYAVGGRGAQVFSVLEPDTPPEDPEGGQI